MHVIPEELCSDFKAKQLGGGDLAWSRITPLYYFSDLNYPSLELGEENTWVCIYRFCSVGQTAILAKTNW